MNSPPLPILSGLALIAFGGILNASIGIHVSTDTSGNFINATGGGAAGTPAAWNELGTVTGSVQGGVTNTSTPMTLISGFSDGGTLSNISMDRDGTFVDYTFTLTPADASMAHSADIDFNVANTGIGNDGWNNIRVRNMTNVAGISFKATFDEPIAARPNSNTPGTVPWGAGMRRHDSNGAGSYDATVTYSGLNTITALPPSGICPLPGSHYNTGITGIMAGGGIQPVNNSPLTAGVGPHPGVLSLSTPSSIVSNGTSQWIGVHGVDFDGNGNVDFSPGGNGVLDGDEERVYLNMVEFDVTESMGNAFASGAAFQFSIDGSQFDDTLPVAIKAASAAIPEPGRASLLILASFLMGIRRQKGPARRG